MGKRSDYDRQPGVTYLACMLLLAMGLPLVTAPIRDWDEIEWLGIVGALALGLPVLALAVVGAYKTTRGLLQREPGEGSTLRRLVTVVGRHRNWRTMLASLPYALMAAQLGVYWAAGLRLPWESRDTLSEVINIEFLSVTSTFFLGWIYAFEPDTRLAGAIKWSLFAAMCVAVAAIAEHNLSHFAYTEMVVLSGAKWGFLIIAPPREARLRIVVSRWAQHFLLFAIIGFTMGAGDDGTLAIEFGALYFAALAVLEFLGLLSADPAPGGLE